MQPLFYYILITLVLTTAAYQEPTCGSTPWTQPPSNNAKCHLSDPPRAGNSQCNFWFASCFILFSNSSYAQSYLDRTITFLNNVTTHCSNDSMKKLYLPTHIDDGINDNCMHVDPMNFNSISTYNATAITNETIAFQYMLNSMANCNFSLTDSMGGVNFIFSDLPCKQLCSVMDHLASTVIELISIKRVVKLVFFTEDSDSFDECMGAITNGGGFCHPPDCSFSFYSSNVDIEEKNSMVCYPDPTTSGGLSDLELGLIIGIPCATIVLIIIIFCVFCLKCAKMRTEFMNELIESGIWSSWMEANEGERRRFPGFRKTKRGTEPNDYSDGRPEGKFDAARRKNKKDLWELEAKNLMVHNDQLLGKGAFANVYMGTITGKIPLLKVQTGVGVMLEHSSDGRCESAVKRLPPHADESNREEFFKEIDFMKRLGYHVHIVAMLGCVTDPHNPLMVVEYCDNGDLLQYLRDHRKQNKVFQEEDPDTSYAAPSLRTKDLVSLSWQIADGMCYLASKNFIHRDLAARNILLTKSLVAKISDFGLCRYTDSSLYTARGGKLPIKWMPIESLKLYVFTEKSDVWSFGVLLWEMFTLGDGPYQSIQPGDMVPYLEKDNRLQQPALCPNEIYTLMSHCWMADAEKRPEFTEIRSDLTAMLNMDDEHYGYLSLPSIDEIEIKLSEPANDE